MGAGLARVALVALVVALPAIGEAAARSRLVVSGASIHRPDAEADHLLAPEEEAARVLAFVPTLEVVASGERLGGGLDRDLRGCAADLRCVAARLEAHHVDLALMILADTGSDPALVTTRLVAARGGEVLATSVAEAAKVELRAVLRAEIARVLTRAGHPLGGRLVVETTPPGASLRVDPGPAGGGGAHLAGSAVVLAPGRYTLIAELEGHASAGQEVRVAPGDELHLHVRLDAEAGILESPWFWAAVIGAVALAGGGAAWLAGQGPGPPRSLCQSRSGSCE